MTDTPRFLDIPGAAARLAEVGLPSSRHHVRRLCQAGRLGTMVAGRYVISEEALAAYVEAVRTESFGAVLAQDHAPKSAREPKASAPKRSKQPQTRAGDKPKKPVFSTGSAEIARFSEG